MPLHPATSVGRAAGGRTALKALPPGPGPDVTAGRPSLATKQALGQYFTPRTIALAAWELLALFQSGGRSRTPTVANRVLEPAVGAGIFLLTGREQGVLGSMVGFDTDPKLAEAWQALRDARQDLTLVCADTLLPHPLLTPAFDVVIGNPPFGSAGLAALGTPKTPEALAIAKTLVKGYQCFRTTSALQRDPPRKGDWTSEHRTLLRKLATFPIECLFVERSLELCAHGGWLVLVLPEGLLTNSRLQGVRDFVAARACVRAVVRLPGTLFRSEGAAARTALLVLEKGGNSAETFLAKVERETDMPTVVEEAERFLSDRKHSSALRAPERRLAAERWDPDYWDPRATETLDALQGHELGELGRFIAFMTYGPIVTGREATPGEIPVIHQGQLAASGLDLRHAKHVTAGSAHDPARSRPQPGDLLFARSGAGSLAKGRMGVLSVPVRANVGCFVDIIRFQGLDPYFAWLFLASRFGQAQILRLINGVATPNLSFKEMRALKIPLLPLERQAALAGLYHESVRPSHERMLTLPQDDRLARQAASDAMRLALERFEALLAAT